MRIEHYEFGQIRIDGREEHADLRLTPTRVLPGRWRREGHVLALQDLDAVLKEQPRRLMVGTGAWGRMRPDAGLEQALRQRAVDMEAMLTPRPFAASTSCSTWATWTGRPRCISRAKRAVHRTASKPGRPSSLVIVALASQR